MNYSLHDTFFWWKQLGALLSKEFKQIARDPSSYLVAGVLPMLFLFIFGYGVSLDAGRLDIACINESGGAASQALLLDFANSPSFRVIPCESREQGGEMMRNSVVHGMVILSQNFDADLLRGQSPQVQLLVDGSEPNTANFIAGYSQGLIQIWSANRSGQSVQPPITINSRYWFNPAALSRHFLVPGSITVIMTLIGTMLTSLVVAREWERGTIETLFASPVDRMQILLSKLIPYFCMGMFSMCLCSLTAVFLFGIPFHGSVGALLLLSSVFMLTSLGQGLLISVITRNQLLAAQAGLITGFLPALILSGFVFDINSMPLALQGITLLIAARYFNTCIQSIFLAGDIWAIFLPCLLYMGLLASLLLFLVYRKLVKRIA